MTVAVTVKVAPSAGLVKVVLTKPLAMSVAVNTRFWVVVPSLTLTVSPTATLILSNATCTATVEAPLSSAVLTKPSLLVSVVILTTGAALPLVAVMSILAESAPSGDSFPAASVTVAVTVKVAPSAGLEKVVLTKPLSISICVKTTSLTVEPSLTRTVSPTATLVLSNAACTATVVAPLSSALLTKPSLLVSVMMLTTGAALPFGAVVSKVALSVPEALWFPATSLILAVTVNVAPSTGFANVVRT